MQISKAACHDCFLGVCDTSRDCLILNVVLCLRQQPLNFGTVAASANAAASLPLVTKVCSNYQKMQTRSISFFPDDASQNPGVVLGSVEGRCSVMYLKEEHR